MIANEVIGVSKIERLLNLTKHTHMMVAVDNPLNVKELSEAATKKRVSLDVLIDLDTGYGRCGVQPGDPALKLAQLIVDSPGLNFKGINGYTPASFDEDHEVKRAKQEKKLRVDIDTRDLLIKNGIEVEIVSAGCTRDFFISAEDSRPKNLKGYELYSLSAEHGKIRVTEPERKLTLGEKIELIPSYGDGTVNRWSRYLGVRNGKLETVIPIYHPY